ncbi:MAG: prolipoprotein diacylglyceryl transferase [Alphaproteobacteria bacterium GM7ARS4]|nr:prolipoprotein diacylglyceryl transferase [Alphaproteobacteria bacterium GM7ARS4]
MENHFLLLPAWDPVAFSIGPLSVHWYGLSYLVSFLLAWRYGLWVIKRYALPITAEQWGDAMLLWCVLGVLIGGRLGYVFLYHPAYYLANPHEIFFIWRGGMSFHGGMVGAGCAVMLYGRSVGVSGVRFVDLVALVSPVGLFFGRLANFVNGELYGRVSHVPWAMIFPHSDGMPRHPSQLYEAALEGIVLGTILFLCVVCGRRRGGVLETRGMMMFLFLLGYGLMRFIVEFWREPDAHIGYIAGLWSLGQILSALMVVAGAVGLWVIHKKAQRRTEGMA